MRRILFYRMRGGMVRRPAPWAVVVLLALVAAGPFITRPGLPHHTDAELHVYRAAELGHTVRGCRCYPRWAPDFYFGYGYPIFNYYAPLTYYLANLLALPPGVSIVAGVKGVFVLGFFVAGAGGYLLGRDLALALEAPVARAEAAGLLAAASFLFAPYPVFIDPHARGDLAEQFAVCLLPLTFYFFRRLFDRRRPVTGWVVGGSVLSPAGVVFSHNLLGLVTAGLLAAYWLWALATGSGRRRALLGVRVFVLAAAVSAFFWLPALAERGAVRLNVVGPGHFDFHEHFLTLGELLAPSRVLDMGAAAPHHRYNLGMAQWLPAVVAGAVVVRRRRWAEVGFFALAGLGLVFLMTAASTPVWEAVPGMAYLQFPWRLLGPTALMLAAEAAALVVLDWGTWPVLEVSLAAVLLSALPTLYPPPWSPDFGPTTPAAIIAWERESLALGTTSTGDFLPVTGALVPVKPAPSLVESYSSPGSVDRVNRCTLPAGTQVTLVEHGPLYDRFAVSSSKKFILRLFTFYFPGWRAYVNGAEVAIELGMPEGFITVPVPAGEHEVVVRFGDTEPRTVGWVVTAVGWLGLAITLRAARGKGGGVRLSDGRAVGRMGAVLLAFILLKTAVLDPHDGRMRYTSPPGEAWAARYPLRADFGHQIELLGYDLPRRRVRSGGTVEVVLYWHALTPPKANYQSFVHLAHPLNVLWGQEDHLNPGGLPTTRWPPNRYVWDAYEVPVLPGTPPGEYELNVGLYLLEGGYRLARYGEDGTPDGDSLVIATVEVRRPRRQPRSEDLGMTRAIEVPFPAGMVLLGYQAVTRQAATVAWRPVLFWRAERDGPAAAVRSLVLRDVAGEEVYRCSGPPVDGRYPFSLWRAGEVVRDPSVFVPQEVGVAAGVYRLWVAVDDGEEVPLGEVVFE